MDQLKALLVCLCLVFAVTQAAAAAGSPASDRPARKAPQAKPAVKRAPVERMKPSLSLERRLERQLDAARKHRSVLRFFGNHRWLLSADEHRSVAREAVQRAKRGLARTTRNIAALRRAIHRRDERRAAKAPPKVAICDVFGRRYCAQALSVSWCESRHSTTAQNGQYLGLFQMGSYARGLYGHGATARQQAEAAHRYFVDSGRDWSPWSCKPLLWS